MKKNSKSYEYMQVEISTGPCSNCIERLDEYGKDGWILVYIWIQIQRIICLERSSDLKLHILCGKFLKKAVDLL